MAGCCRASERGEARSQQGERLAVVHGLGLGRVAVRQAAQGPEDLEAQLHGGQLEPPAPHRARRCVQRDPAGLGGDARLRAPRLISRQRVLK